MVSLKIDEIERFCESFIRSDSCWYWRTPSTDLYYGQFKSKGKRYLAHRVAYELFNGVEIPTGLEIDHLCHNRPCVNPSHLEAVTHKVNQQRSWSPVGENAKKVKCLNGHIFTDANTYVYRWERHCKMCRRLRQREYIKRRALSSLF